MAFSPKADLIVFVKGMVSKVKDKLIPKIRKTISCGF